MTRRFPDASTAMPPAPLWRRFAAMGYDALLIIALAFVVTAVYLAVNGALMGADALKAHLDSGGMGRDPLYRTLLFLSIFFFFAYFWHRLGQTLGMQAWRVRVQNQDGTTISWTQCALRFMVALISWLCAGLGYFWMLWDKQGRTWHDLYSESQTVLLPPRTKKPI